MPHSFLPPSGAAGWSRCALWPTMNAQFPQDASPEAIEGTAAHWVADEYLAERYPSVGSAAPNGAIVTEEMRDGAELRTEVIETRMRGKQLHIEESVAVASIHRDCFGTPDVWAFNMDMAHLHIVDYKFGHGFVDEFFNFQGLLYALGIIETLKLPGNPKHVTVSFTIVQPRCYMHGEPVRTHRYTIAEAAEYIANLKRAALAAYEARPLATTGGHCQYCPGRHACSALQQAAYSAAEISSDRQPHNLSPQAAALELRMLERALERLEARVDGLRELTLANLKSGIKIPYYHIGEGKGRAQWNIPHEQIVALGEMFGKNLSKPGVVTPAQAKKLGVDQGIVDSYSFMPSGNLKLIADNPSDARRVFGQQESE